MAPPNIESQYKDLLSPVKDPEQSFGINIAELLQDYLSQLVQGRVPPNFNSAALLLQGSTSIYSKKVEYLHNLATQLHQNLIKQKKAEQVKKDNVKEKEKTKATKTNQVFSVDIKLGKNLSCLTKKNSSKNSSGKKLPKKIRNMFMPVHLMPMEGDEKGDVLYDIRGQKIGYRGDYAINKCKLTSTGWLLLPSVSSSLITTPYIYEESYNDSSIDKEATNVADDLPNTPCIDEGLGSEPPHSEQVNSSPMEGVESQDGSQPASSDLGIDINCSMDADDEHVQNPSEEIENVPTSKIEDSSVTMPVRHSVRQALKELASERNKDAQSTKRLGRLHEKKPIRKGNVVSLPRSLRNGGRKEKFEEITVFCSRTFFFPEAKLSRREKMLWESVSSFQRNSKFFKILTGRLKDLRAAERKRSNPFEEDDEVNVEDDVESVRGSDEDHGFTPLEDCDIPIDNDLENNFSRDANEECPPGTPPAFCESPLAGELPGENLQALTNRHIEECTRELQNFVLNSESSRKVHEWESFIRPALSQIEERESFDINLYGSRILNAFEDSNRKQTMTFKEFCKGKKKWEIHRYFMALLPLANIGNVSIETEPSEDGTEEEIFMTLRSRKMHHTELEEFGHGSGEHP